MSTRVPSPELLAALDACAVVGAPEFEEPGGQAARRPGGGRTGILLAGSEVPTVHGARLEPRHVCPGPPPVTGYSRVTASRSWEWPAP